MADKPYSSDPEIRNPRYKGATPEDVARALLNKWGAPPKDDEAESESETEAA